MAACTLAVGTADTGITPNTSGAFTPAADDLLIGLVVVSASASVDSTLTSSVGGFTFTRILEGTFDAGADSVVAFVADALTTAVSQTVTFSGGSDEGNGSHIFVYRVSGMTKVGTAAIRQSAEAFGTALATPGIDFASACLTGNPTLCVLGNNSNPAGVTPPTNWTESSDIGYDNPTTGGEACHRDSGFTGTAVDWAALSPTLWGAIGIELDTSATTEGTATPGTGPATVVGQIPGEYRELNQNIGLGAAAIAGQIPVASGYLFPGVGAASAAGQIPDEYRELNQAIGLGSAVIAGQIPASLGDGALGPDKAPLSIAGLVPSLGTELVVSTTSALVILDGRIPVVDQGAIGVELTAEPGVGLVAFGALVPDLAVEYDKPRGHVIKSKRRRSRNYGPLYYDVSKGAEVVVVEPTKPTTVVELEPVELAALDTGEIEGKIRLLETRRSRLARMRREEEELVAILMRVA